jgi:hypothetical protein
VGQVALVDLGFSMHPSPDIPRCPLFHASWVGQSTFLLNLIERCSPTSLPSVPAILSIAGAAWCQWQRQGGLLHSRENALKIAYKFWPISAPSLQPRCLLAADIARERPSEARESRRSDNAVPIPEAPGTTEERRSAVSTMNRSHWIGREKPHRGVNSLPFFSQRSFSLFSTGR